MAGGAPKRKHESADDNPAALEPPRKAHKGFNIGPANLPDGTWKRKVSKIKKDLIHRAKVKKTYAKVKARQEQERPGRLETTSNTSHELHAERKAMLEAPLEQEEDSQPCRNSQRRRDRKPKCFEKEQAVAEKRRGEAEARRQEFARREKERKAKMEQRERFRKAMAKAKIPAKNGQRRLGRESEVLLGRVKRIMED